MRKQILIPAGCLAAALLLAGLIFPTGSQGDAVYDILIKNGKVFDGSANPAVNADIAIKGDTIINIGDSIQGKASQVIDAKGLHVAPGFIDLHTHVDRNMYFPESRACLNYLKQGTTTVVVGQCGQSAWPVFEQAIDQMRRWNEEGIGPNAALLVGHGTVRNIVMGMENRKPTPEELEKMKGLVKQAMEQGAYGLSTGLIYRPGTYAETEEVIELAKVITPYGGIYHTHIRNEWGEILDAVKEAIRISRESGAPAHISHFKVMGKDNWGLSKDACALIEEARAQGLHITADQYPYRFSNGYPYASLIPASAWRGKDGPEGIVPDDVRFIFDHLRDNELIALYKKATPYFPVTDRHQKFLESLPRTRLVDYVSSTLMSSGRFYGPENTRERMLFLERMKDPDEAEKIRRTVEKYVDTVGAENIIVGICAEKEWEGKSLKELSDIRGKSVADAAIELELMGAKCIPLRMSEDDIEYIMQKDYVGTGSDGTAPFYGIGLNHIRSYSTFLHKIKKYALERKAVSVPHVIRAQTSLPASIMNWTDRGRIKKGYKADIAVIDLDNIQTKTSIHNPHQYSEGVEYLLINGRLVLDEGEYTGELPGEVLKLRN